MKSLVFGQKWRGFAFACGVLLFLSAATGCGPNKSKISGKVLYKGAPLPGGLVTFRPADSKQNSVAATIDAEGNYSAEVPVGDVKVCVDNLMLQERKSIGLGPKIGPKLPKGDAPKDGSSAEDSTKPEKPPGKYVKLPEKYADADKSGLDFKVTGPTMEHNVELQGDK